MLSGFTFFDDKRPQSLRIQPSIEKFAATFNQLSDGLLNGLDWNNIFVAGGIALAVGGMIGDSSTTLTALRWILTVSFLGTGGGRSETTRGLTIFTMSFPDLWSSSSWHSGAKAVLGRIDCGPIKLLQLIEMPIGSYRRDAGY